MRAYLVRLTWRMSGAAARVMGALARLVIVAASLASASAFGVRAQEHNTPARAPQRFVHEGVAVELSVESLEAGKGEDATPTEGKQASVRFKITDANTGSPVTGLHPSAWIDRREAGATDDAKNCSDKVR